MAFPTRYVISYSFDAFQSANPTIPLPADKLEIELNNLVLTTNEIIDNLSIIQRSDGLLANQIVSFDSLSNDVKTLLGSSINPRGAWLTATAYKKLDLITQAGSTYLAVLDHTSGVFATDLSANRWVLWAAVTNVVVNNSNWSGAQLTVPNGGTGVTTLTGIIKGNGTSAFTAATQGTDYYAPSGTDVAVTDGGTGASTAADARTNLGLGALATLGSVNDGNWSGTDLSINNGGTGASTAADARTALDVYSKGEVDFEIDAIITPWVAYTPSSIQGLTAFADASFRSRKVGSNLEIEYVFRASTVNSSQMRIPMGYNGVENNVTAANNYPNNGSGYGNLVGHSSTTGARDYITTLLAVAGQTYLLQGIDASASFQSLQGATGTASLIASALYSGKASVRIQGW